MAAGPRGCALDAEAESRAKLAPSGRRDAQCAAIQVANQPFPSNCDIENCCTECTAQMRAALTPVETRISEAASQGPGAIDVEAELRQGFVSEVRQLVGVFLALIRLKPGAGDEMIVQRDRQPTGHVVVAGARRTQTVRHSRRHVLLALSGEHRQRLDHRCGRGTLQSIVAMLAARHDRHQILLLQATEMRAGRGRAHIGDDGKFRAGACAPIHQANQNARARRLADRSCERGDTSFAGGATSTVLQRAKRGSQLSCKHSLHAQYERR